MTHDAPYGRLSDASDLRKRLALEQVRVLGEHARHERRLRRLRFFAWLAILGVPALLLRGVDRWATVCEPALRRAAWIEVGPVVRSAPIWEERVLEEPFAADLGQERRSAFPRAWETGPRFAATFERRLDAGLIDRARLGVYGTLAALGVAVVSAIQAWRRVRGARWVFLAASAATFGALRDASHQERDFLTAAAAAFRDPARYGTGVAESTPEVASAPVESRPGPLDPPRRPPRRPPSGEITDFGRRAAARERAALADAAERHAETAAHGLWRGRRGRLSGPLRPYLWAAAVLAYAWGVGPARRRDAWI
ncbi:MAG TPA: hypothetical protein VEI02_14300 [Planctomycetota bacterium]|nr:hypothetical protein [Planctomycetota bacterium]